ncbi:unnamed protein product [Rhizophagus irregularis]|nr:unnamed protein product [Rhizophagus irregularis]
MSVVQSEHSKKYFVIICKVWDAYARHKKFMKDYVNFYGRERGVGQTSTSIETKTEFDILKENHKFLRTEDEEEEELSWEQRVAKKYYDKLFKEYYCLRWRIEKEVISGKGQFVCASTRCSSTNELKSWEVNFAYMEDGEKKNAPERNIKKRNDIRSQKSDSTDSIGTRSPTPIRDDQKAIEDFDEFFTGLFV